MLLPSSDQPCRVLSEHHFPLARYYLIYGMRPSWHSAQRLIGLLNRFSVPLTSVTYEHTPPSAGEGGVGGLTLRGHATWDRRSPLTLPSPIVFGTRFARLADSPGELSE